MTSLSSTGAQVSPDKPESADAHSPRRLPPFVVRLALELLVVFIGVYAAFALSENENQRDAAVRRQQLKSALLREIQGITSNTRRVAQQLPPQLARLDSAIKAGARPPLEPFIEPVRVQNHMWEATLQSGAMDFFDVPTIYNLSRFYNELNAGFEQISQLRALSESVLIPNLGQDRSEFYNDDGDLRPKYQWYRDGLARLSMLAGSITAFGDSLVVTLSPETAAAVGGH